MAYNRKISKYRRYSKYNNRGNYNRGNYNYRRVTNNEKREFRGIKDLKPEPKNEQTRPSLTIGQVELLKAVLAFIKNKDTLKAEELNVTAEEINTAHKVLMALYNIKNNSNVPDKEYWKNFFTWLTEQNKQG